jgi:hypothetical protein
MTNIIDRARELLTCDELRGRVPEEVRALLADIVALEPVAYLMQISYESEPGRTDTYTFPLDGSPTISDKHELLYALGAPNDPA